MTGATGRDGHLPRLPGDPLVISDWSTASRPAVGGGYRELLAVPALSVGRFTAPVGYADAQSPHAEDEVYVVTAGRAVLVVGDERNAVAAGSVAYVPAGTSHRFTDVSEAVDVLVLFAPGPR